MIETEKIGELLIVVVVLGILSAIIIPQFQQAQQEAQREQEIMEVDTVSVKGMADPNLEGSIFYLVKLKYLDTWGCFSARFFDLGPEPDGEVDKVFYCYNEVVFDPETFDPRTGFPKGFPREEIKISQPGSLDWDIWEKRFKEQVMPVHVKKLEDMYL